MSAAVIVLLYASLETPGILSGMGVTGIDTSQAGHAGEGREDTRQQNSRRSADEKVVCQASSDPDLWLYRDRTVALLRRYLRLSIEVGRTPSLLGREFFRSRVTSYGYSTFEDSVIFVHDVERSLEELNEF
jgi:hypothetical protein